MKKIYQEISLFVFPWVTSLIPLTYLNIFKVLKNGENICKCKLTSPFFSLDYLNVPNFFLFEYILHSMK